MTEQISIKKKLIEVRATLEFLINQIESLFDDAFILDPNHTAAPCKGCIELRHQLEANLYKPTATEESLIAEISSLPPAPGPKKQPKKQSKKKTETPSIS